MVEIYAVSDAFGKIVGFSILKYINMTLFVQGSIAYEFHRYKAIGIEIKYFIK